LKPRFLLDTHILVRWLVEPKKLSQEQRSAIEGAKQSGEPVAFSAMSLTKIAVLVSSEKLKLNVRLDEFFGELQANPFFQILPITFEIAAEVASLGRSLSDPTDRTIVATARVHRLRLVTSDQRIIESKLASVVE
jgi:PIN domain nuclease of toxin-antitoxin system